MKAIKILALSGIALALTACAATHPVGTIMTNVTLPVTATSNEGGSSKTGEAVCTSFLTMIASGDCSIDAAKKNGGITKVNHVDWHAKSFLGITGTYTLKVYGD